jgi:hypothetical protein
MAKRSERRICAQEGCRAWAMRGARFCVAHRRRKAPHAERGEGAGGGPSPLQRLLAHSAAEDVGADLPLIDRELAALLDARHYFLSWVAELRAAEDAGPDDPGPGRPGPGRPGPARPGPTSGGRAGAQPAQFLRAWNDSSARIVALLRARRALAGGHEAFDALVDEIIAELEVPVEAPTADRAAAGGAHDHAH